MRTKRSKRESCLKLPETEKLIKLIKPAALPTISVLLPIHVPWTEMNAMNSEPSRSYQ